MNNKIDNKMEFATVFFGGTNIILEKDVGQIPLVLHNKFGLDTAIIGNKFDLDASKLKQVEGFKVLNYKSVFKDRRLVGLAFLCKNARKIQWLNIYHADKKSLYWAKCYKFFNPTGKVYLKLDADFRTCKLLEKNPKKQKMFDKCLRAMDIVSAETQEVLDRLQKYTRKEIFLISNGYCEDNRPINVAWKEDVFLTVGRLGTEQKATEILLQAFAKSKDEHNWKLKLVGTIEDEFKKYIDEYYQTYPDLVNRVIFTGAIADREAVSIEYEKAKVFVLPSRWESFGFSTIKRNY